MLSVEEMLVKKEEELQLARNTIGMLNTDFGTIMVEDSNCESDEYETKSDETVNAKIAQYDALFGSKFTFETNVSFLSTSLLLNTDLLYSFSDRWRSFISGRSY